MPDIKGHTDFNPDKDIPSLSGKVIFITGGTAGLGRQYVSALARHDPAHIYFTGRNTSAAEALINDVHKTSPSLGLTFLEMDMTSLSSVKSATSKFAHDRLDILMANAGILATPPGLSKDGIEIQFAVNHLGNAMVIRELLPVLQRTAEKPGSDVRIICATSTAWEGHPKEGIEFDKLRTTQERLFGSWVRYSQSKLANVVYPAELARRYPQILAVSVHPGTVKTGAIGKLSLVERTMIYVAAPLFGVSVLEPEQGCYSQLWVAAAAKRSELVNGAFYMPIGVMSNNKLDKFAGNEEFAKKVWDWTDEVLSKY